MSTTDIRQQVQEQKKRIDRLAEQAKPPRARKTEPMGETWSPVQTPEQVQQDAEYAAKWKTPF